MKRALWLCAALVSLFCSSGFAAIAHVAGCSVSGHFNAASNSETFTCTPNAANDAIVFKVTCGDSGTVTAISLTAIGWTITSLSGVTGSSTAGWAASFGAIALAATSTTFTATFTGASTCSSYEDYAADEFSGNDTSGGTTTFDAHNQATGTGSCSVSVTPSNNNDAVWGACEDSTTAVGSGYTKGQDDAGGDWTQYKILSGGSGIAQTVNFTGSGAYNALAVTIKPAGGAAAPTGFDKRQKIEKLDTSYSPRAKSEHERHEVLCHSEPLNLRRGIPISPVLCGRTHARMTIAGTYVLVPIGIPPFGRDDRENHD